MNDLILQHWQFQAKIAGNSLIIPDGCRDLIFRASAGKKPHWQITSLDDTAYKVSSVVGDFFMGYRFRPGISIDGFAILSALKNLEPGKDVAEKHIEDMISNYCLRSPNTELALACLGAGRKNVSMAARELGIGLRSLQRLVLKGTGKTPAFWTGLARARKVARELASGGALAQIAFDFEYSDQAHMSRDIKRWFGVSPGRIKYQSGIVTQLNQAGFS
ncbi:MAG: helix-turn-helix domain-containing protein [Devosiaceae bacterium]|nr:helix-turn-helix domain-containing protein [Devosiaceae bacterium]